MSLVLGNLKQIVFQYLMLRFTDRPVPFVLTQTIHADFPVTADA